MPGQLPDRHLHTGTGLWQRSLMQLATVVRHRMISERSGSSPAAGACGTCQERPIQPSQSQRTFRNCVLQLKLWFTQPCRGTAAESCLGTYGVPPKFIFARRPDILTMTFRTKDITSSAVTRGLIVQPTIDGVDQLLGFNKAGNSNSLQPTCAVRRLNADGHPYLSQNWPTNKHSARGTPPNVPAVQDALKQRSLLLVRFSESPYLARRRVTVEIPSCMIANDDYLSIANSQAITVHTLF